MSTQHVDFVEGGRAALFGRENRRRNLPTRLGTITKGEPGENKHTSVIAGHGMPERSKGRAKAGHRRTRSVAVHMALTDPWQAVQQQRARGEG